MNKSQIFFIFKENINLDKIINNIQSSYAISNNNNYINKIYTYINQKAQQFIKYHNHFLEFKETNIFTIPNLPRYIFAIIITKTNTNHPYLLFFSLDNNLITFLIPYGGDKKQADIQTYYSAIDESNLIECYAILLLLEKTIYIRKIGIVDSKQFSLINCSNITNCVKKLREIDKMHINHNEKLKQKQLYNDYYLHKAIDFLKYYFNLLENQKFDDAELFLKGSNKSYFGKQRLNTFFKNTKSIIGHLEIFLSLYTIYHHTKLQIYNGLKQ